MKVSQICSRRAVMASASAPLSDVARLMYDQHVGAVIITRSPADRPVPVGIVTDRDVVRAQLQYAGDLTRLPTSEAMTPNPLTVCEEDTVEDALSRLRARNVRRAPVLDNSGGIIGMISTDDLIEHVAREVAGLGRLLERQTGHRA